MQKRRFWPCLFPVVSLFILLVLSASIDPVRAEEPRSSPSLLPTTPPAKGRKILVDAHDRSTLNRLSREGATMLVDYGSFSLWRAPGQEDGLLAALPGASAESERASELDTIFLRGIDLHPTSGDTPAIAADLQQTRTEAPQFWMLQFVGPVKDAWLTEVRQTGVDLVSYIPNHAYVVWGGGAELARLEQLADERLFLQWTGAYHPAYRLEPSLRQTALQHTSDDTSESTEVTSVTDVMVQFYTTEETGHSLARLQAMSPRTLMQPFAMLGYTNIALQIPTDRLQEVAHWAAVYNVEPWSPPELMDEVQGQIMSGQVVVSDDGTVGPEGPGYLDWINRLGFSTNPADYPVVDVVDDGLDIGDANDVRHPDLHESGLINRPDRVAYIENCTPDLTGNGPDGHGNINAGIVASYNNLSGEFHVDEQGYRRGLGISPYGRVASTKIFQNGGYYDISGCGDTYEGVVVASVTNGADLTSNSWGHSGPYYDTGAQVYDRLTRDAAREIAGHQEMLHVFAAGNAGPYVSTVGSPGVAKNVLTVGATENVRDDGVYDGCEVDDSDSADDMAEFSGRGPTSDGRAKPDLVAPGIHIQGPASQDPSFDGSAVCGGSDSPYYPSGQTLYTWSSGTSHSTPAVAGAASLVSEYYQRVLLFSQEPSPAMLKALLVNSTRYLDGNDTGDTLPSDHQGWGGVNLGMIFDDVPRFLVDQSTVFNETGEEYTISGAIFDPSKPLRVSLVWTDAPGSTSSGSFVNNLDLMVETGGKVYHGNQFDGAFSVPVTEETAGTFDERNNVEQVFVQAGGGASFTVRVIARNLAGDGIPDNSDETDQDFALVVYNDSAGTLNRGNVEGTIADRETGEPVDQALVQASLTATRTISVRSQDDGKFSLPLPEGTYSLQFSAYGYAPITTGNVVVKKQERTAQDLTLEPLPRVTVQGNVTKGEGTGRPLYASVNIAADGYQETVFTDPLTGIYTAPLVPDISHTFTVDAIGVAPSEDDASYIVQTNEVTPRDGGTTRNFTLAVNKEACTAPGYQHEVDTPVVSHEDFEASSGPFDLNWSSSWQWGPPTNGPERAHSGDYVLSARSQAYGTLESEDRDLSDYEGQHIFLSWWQWLHIFGEGDFVVVAVSKDSGEHWEVVFDSAGAYMPEVWEKHGVLLDSSYAVSTFRLGFYTKLYKQSSSYAIDDITLQPFSTRTIYAEDFELSNGGYVTATDRLTSWEWGTPITGPGVAHSGRSAWATNLSGYYFKDEHNAIVSPPVNLRGYANQMVQLSWWEWGNIGSRAYVAVEVSNDGGASWEAIYQSGEGGMWSEQWQKRRVVLDPAYAVADFRLRFLFHSSGSRLWDTAGYYLDDVRIEASDHLCKEQDGGVLFGHVYDANTGEGLNEVWVSDDQEHAAFTVATDEDPALDDGFYLLFLPEGSHAVTATVDTPYQTAHITSSVGDGSLLRHDFRLPAGELSYNLPPLDVTLAMSTSKILPFDLSNSGTYTANFAIQHIAYGYQPPSSSLSSVLLPARAAATTTNTADPHRWSARVLADRGRVAEPSHLPNERFSRPEGGSMEADQRWYEPSSEALFQANEVRVLFIAAAQVEEMLSLLQAYPDIEQAESFDASQATPTLDTLLGYDSVLVVADQPFADPEALGDVLADYVDAGGSVVQTVPTFAGASDRNDWSVQGRFAEEGYSPFVARGDSAITDYNVLLGDYLPSHPIMRGIRFVESTERFRQDVYLAPEAKLVASWDDAQALVATKGGVVALNVFIADNGWWTGDIDVIVHNSIIWLETRDDTPWLSISPPGGTLATSATVPLSLTFDTTGSQITQPGTYLANMRIVSSTPYEDATIPITLTVKEPTSWGGVAGTVASSGYCQRNPHPLEYAQVLIETTDGTQTRIHTDEQGAYQFWLSEQSGPVTLTVSAPDHQTFQEQKVPISHRATIFKDISLDLQQPCITANLMEVERTLQLGERETVPLTLTNSGTVSTPVKVSEASLGFSQPAAALALTEPGATLALSGTASPIPTGPRNGAAMATCDGQTFYLFGGYSTLSESTLDETWQYFPSNDQWIERAPMPFALSSMEAVCIGNMIYLVGGFQYGDPTDMFLRYDTVHDTWFASTWPDERSPLLTTWNGKLYALGGISYYYDEPQETWMYDPITDEWAELASMPEEISGGAAVTVDDTIYVIGAYTRVVQRYAPRTDTWDRSGPPLKQEYISPLALWYGDEIFVIGQPENEYSTRTVEVYRPSLWPDGEWEYSDLSLPYTLSSMAGACVGDKIWAAGGYDFDAGTFSVNQYLDGKRFCHRSNEADLDWLSHATRTTTLQPGESLTLDLLFDASGPATQRAGDYRALLLVQSDDPERDWFKIPVTLKVQGNHRLYLPFVVK